MSDDYVVRKIRAEGNKIVEDVFVKPTNYEMSARYWFTSKNKFIREWTSNEYATLNPNNEYVINLNLDNGEEIGDVIAHCVEVGTMNAYKNGHKVISFHKTIDYSKKK